MLSSTPDPSFLTRPSVLLDAGDVAARLQANSEGYSTMLAPAIRHGGAFQRLRLSSGDGGHELEADTVTYSVVLGACCQACRALVPGFGRVTPLSFIHICVAQ